ncbi:MAG: family 16 glycosylhydrolase [Verrucomicrobiota bacterium]
MNLSRLKSCLALAALVLLSPSLHAAPPGKGWALAWSDEFGGTSLNGSNWSVGTGNRRDAVNSANALSVQSGYLRIKTYTEGGTHYTGWVGTQSKFENCFGYWEARIRYNSSQGMWSAFWLQPYGINNVGDPAGNGTEIDIAEHRSRDTGGANLTNSMTMNVHWDGYAGSHKSVGSTVGNPGANGASLQGNFHTYGLLWESGRYRFFIDGVEVWTTTAAISQVRQWIYLTSEVESGAWAGPTPSSYGDRNSSSTYQDIDYVRFYQRSEQTINSHFGFRMGPWRQIGSASWAAGAGRNGTAAARLNPSGTGGGRVAQKVVGLLQNTPYVVRGWGDVGSRTWPDIRFGARDYGGPETFASVWSNGYTSADAVFTTGASNTTADVFAWVPTQYGDCYGDDIEIRRAGRFTNGGFETGDASQWNLYGDSLVQSWGGAFCRSGSSALRLNGSAAVRGGEHPLYGLKPETTYSVSAWVKGNGQPVQLGVKGHGSAEATTPVTGSGGAWTRGSHSFTTGPGMTTATVVVYANAGSNVSAVDLDDFLLVEALPAQWTAEDIGSALAGESGSNDGRLIVRGSGNNLGSSADSLRFIHQEMVDSGQITARLNSFEANSDFAKSGVMLRASAAANAPFAMVHWLPQGQIEFYWRNTWSATGSYVWATATTPNPPRLRLVRAGNVVNASYSTDGSTWIPVGTGQAIDLPSTALAGLAVTSNDTSDTAEAVFSNVSFTTDRDGDGLSDDYETNTGIFVSGTDTGTDPDLPDTDGDGYKDGEEVLNGTDPLVANTEIIWQPGASPGGNGTWSSAVASWNMGSSNSAWIPGKTALFGGSVGTVAVGSGATSIAGMIFNTTGYLLNGSGPLGFAADATIVLNAAASHIATPIAGTSSVTVSGGNQLTLRGDNRGFNGSLTLEGNTQLRGYNTDALTATGFELGGVNTTVDVREGSYLRWFQVNGTPSYGANLRLNGVGSGGVLVNDAGAANPAIVLNGSVTLDSDAKISAVNSGRFSLYGALTGERALTWEQGGLSSTIAGPVDLTALTKTGGGILSFTSETISIDTLLASAGTVNFSPFAESVFSGSLVGTASVTKTGVGTLVLAGSNYFGSIGGSFSFGGTNTNVGAIRLAHPQALGNQAKVVLLGQNSAISRLELSGGFTFPLHVDSWGRTSDIAYTGIRNVSGANTLQGNITQIQTGGGIYIDTLTGTQLSITGNVTNTINNAVFRDIRFTGGGTTIIQGAVLNSTTATPTLMKLTKEGPGTLVLNGTNTHGNAATDTVVSEGRLLVNGSITASPVTVAAAGTLGGNGSIANATVAGKISPGNSMGTLTATGNLTITGTWEAEVGGSGADRLNVTGALVLTEGTLDFNLLAGGTTEPLHVIASYGSLSGVPTVTDLPFGYALDLNHDGLKRIALVRTATPFAIWANGHGLSDNDALAIADPDADGTANSVEYLLAMDPSLSDVAGLPSAVRVGNQLVFSFTREKSAAQEFSGVVEISTTLDGGAWSDVPHEQVEVTDLGAKELVTATVPIPEGTERCFARLKVAPFP